MRYEQIRGFTYFNIKKCIDFFHMFNVLKEVYLLQKQTKNRTINIKVLSLTLESQMSIKN